MSNWFGMKDYYEKPREKYRENPEAYWSMMAEKYGDVAILVPGDIKLKNEYYDSLHRRALRKVLGTIQNGAKVLDVGCGVGRWSIMLAKQGCDITGVDMSPQMLVLAKRNAAAENLKINFIESPADSLDLPENSFDVILSVTVLHHIIDDEKKRKTIENLMRILKPGGKLILLEKTKIENIKEFHVTPLTVDGWKSIIPGSKITETHGVDVAPFVSWVTAVGTAFVRRKPSEEFPGAKSVEETTSALLRTLYSLASTVAILLSRPVDYVLADAPFFRNYTMHTLMVFEKL